MPSERSLFRSPALVLALRLVQLPLSLLRAGKDNPMLVELKNGETYNGILINCDIWSVDMGLPFLLVRTAFESRYTS